MQSSSTPPHDARDDRHIDKVLRKRRSTKHNRVASNQKLSSFTFRGIAVGVSNVILAKLLLTVEEARYCMNFAI